jgi:hypothetical protein
LASWIRALAFLSRTGRKEKKSSMFIMKRKKTNDLLPTGILKHTLFVFCEHKMARSDPEPYQAGSVINWSPRTGSVIWIYGFADPDLEQ